MSSSETQSPAFTIQNVISAVRYSLSTPKRIFDVFLISLVVILAMLFGVYPTYSFAMLSSGVGQWSEAFRVLLNTMMFEQGSLGIGLLIVYAVLTAIVIRVLVGRASMIQADSTVGWFVAFAGMATAGCASCGAGFIGFLGSMGGLAVIPFDVTGMRIIAIVLLIVYLAYEGDPTVCVVDGT